MRILRQVGVAVVVMAVGGALAIAGQLQMRHAAARRVFLMMRYAEPIEEYDALNRATRFVPVAGELAAWRADLRTHHAESQYWLQHYQLLVRPDETDGR